MQQIRLATKRTATAERESEVQEQRDARLNANLERRQGYTLPRGFAWRNTTFNYDPTFEYKESYFFFFMNGNTERAQCALSRVCIP